MKVKHAYEKTKLTSTQLAGENRLLSTLRCSPQSRLRRIQNQQNLPSVRLLLVALSVVLSLLLPSLFRLLLPVSFQRVGR